MRGVVDPDERAVAHPRADRRVPSGPADPARLALRPHVPRLLLEWDRHSAHPRWAEVDGSLVLLDISGFTALSERLAAHGRRGAEMITELVDRCFSRFLEVAYEDDGGLLKFGGDALLLLFDGEEHAARACRAAHRMREQLTDVARPREDIGEAALSMSVGVSSGTVTLLLAGESHRELVVAGPVAAAAAELEGLARSGEILVGAATAARLHPSVLGAGRGRGRQLAAAPSIAPPAGPTPLRAGADPEPFVPAGLRAYLGAGHLEGEHRQACLAFVQVGGIHAALAESGPEATADLLDEVVGAVQAAVDVEDIVFQNSDLSIDGCKLLLVAGAPRASDRDEERLLRAVRRIADDGPRLPLPLRIGVSRGRVFTGVIGTGHRRTYAVMGDAVNVAARLAARAEPTEVIATPSVLERCLLGFDAEPIEPLILKGKARPVSAVRLGRLRGGRRAAAGEGLPLVGRERELTALRADLTSAIDGRGRLVEVIGEPGIGKSRLVEELRRLCAEITAAAVEVVVASVECDPYETATPYSAAGRLLRSLLGAHAGVPAPASDDDLRSRLEKVAPELRPWLPLLAIVIDIEVPPTPETDTLDPSFRRARLHDAVTALLDRLLPGPALVCFEDGHWMDDASAALVAHLGHQLRARPWLLCITRRQQTGGFVLPADVPGSTVRLEALSADAASELVAADAGGAVEPDDLAALAERAGGNPLFLRELLRANRDGGEAGDHLPESVEAVITSRIDRLGAADRSVLRRASVLGAGFEEAALVALCAGSGAAAPDAGTWERLGELVSAEAPGTYRFRHALFRDAAYAGLAFTRRRELHALAGVDAEIRLGARADEHAELLSLHYALGEVHDRAYRYSWMAAERARAKFANTEAAMLYRRALEAAEADRAPAARLATTWESLGDVCELAGRYGDATRAYQQAQELAVEPLARPRLLRKAGRVREQTGHCVGALSWYQTALRSLDRLPEGRERRCERMHLELRTAGAYQLMGAFTEAVTWAERAAADAEAIGDRAGLAQAYYLLHGIHTLAGNPERDRYRTLALPIFEEIGDLVKLGNALNNLGIDAYYEGDWEAALAHYERSLAVRERSGDTAGREVSLNNIAEIRSDQGHLDEARSLFERVRALALETGFPLLVAVAEANLGRVDARAGDLVSAERRYEDALAQFQRLKARNFVLETRARQAEASVLGGEPAEALRIVDEVLEASREGGVAALEPLLWRVRGAALGDLGRVDEAAAALERSLALGRQANAAYEVALTLGAAAAFRSEHAEQLRAESAVLLERLGVVATAG